MQPKTIMRFTEGDAIVCRQTADFIDSALADARSQAEHYDDDMIAVVCAGPPICVLRGRAAKRAYRTEDCRWCFKFAVNPSGRVAVRQRYGIA